MDVPGVSVGYGSGLGTAVPRFNPWPRNFCMLVGVEKEEREKERKRERGKKEGRKRGRKKHLC